jgi:hypothetical protein
VAIGSSVRCVYSYLQAAMCSSSQVTKFCRFSSNTVRRVNLTTIWKRCAPSRPRRDAGWLWRALCDPTIIAFLSPLRSLCQVPSIYRCSVYRHIVGLAARFPAAIVGGSDNLSQAVLAWRDTRFRSALLGKVKRTRLPLDCFPFSSGGNCLSCVHLFDSFLLQQYSSFAHLLLISSRAVQKP